MKGERSTAIGYIRILQRLKCVYDISIGDILRSKIRRMDVIHERMVNVIIGNQK